ncbi:MAG: hypothetical protein KTR31_37800 [Myxococcales bacterium]|nr:hypothetical protein [Myxococcales bacterium]
MIGLTLVAGAVAGVPGDEAPWKTVRNDIVRVECAEVSGEPWCRSVGLLAAPIDTLDDVLVRIEHTAHRFEKVLSAVALDPATRHVTIDYPALLSDRDYVARYQREATEGRRVLSWVPVEHPSAPPVEGVVRLTEFEGEWQLEAVGEHTRVWHIWHADPAGHFPKWAMSQAQKRTGYEVLLDLARASGATLLPR